MLIEFLWPVFAEHGALEQASNFFGLTFEHGGLVGHTQMFKITIGVKTWGGGIGEPFHKRLAIAVAENVFSDKPGFFKIENNEIGSCK